MTSDEPPQLDEQFIRAARIRESDLRPSGKPSRDSMREVKREARERARKAPGKRRSGLAGLGRGGRVMATVGVLVLVGAAVVGAEQLHLLRGTESSAASALPVVVGSPLSVSPSAEPPVPVVVPTARASAEPTSRPAKKDPFAGSIVAAWPHGDRGLVPPKALAKGTFTSAAVGDAYRRTAKFLHEAMLDPAVVYHGEMDPVWSTLRPSFVHVWKASLARGVRALPDIATRFRQPGVLATGYPVHVNGTMGTSLDKYGRLLVTFHYVAVYAVRGHAGAEAVLVGVRRDGVAEFDATRGDMVDPPWLVRSGYISDRSDCTKKWLYPSFTQVYLPQERATSSAAPLGVGASSPAPEVTFAILDPRATLAATKPHQCLNDTTALK